MEGQGRSWKVFSPHWIYISGEKSYWWGGGWPVELLPQPQSQSLSSRLKILDLGLNLGLTKRLNFLYLSINICLHFHVWVMSSLCCAYINTFYDTIFIIKLTQFCI